MAKQQRRRAPAPAPRQQRPAQQPQQPPIQQPPAQDYDNDMRGALFANKDKQPGDKRPDYKGSCEIHGVKYWQAGWKRMSKQNQPYISFTYELQDGQDLDYSQQDGVNGQNVFP